MIFLGGFKFMKQANLQAAYFFGRAMILSTSIFLTSSPHSVIPQFLTVFLCGCLCTIHSLTYA